MLDIDIYRHIPQTCKETLNTQKVLVFPFCVALRLVLRYVARRAFVFLSYYKAVVQECCLQNDRECVKMTCRNRLNYK